MLLVNDQIQIPLSELNFTFARSAGPGGQHVNKTNTKVTLHWPVLRSKSLPDDVRSRFAELFRRRINNLGEVVVRSQRFRDRGRNVADCLAKLREMILLVAIAPKKRKPTRPTKAARRRRLDDKRKLSQKKQLRQRPNIKNE